MRISDIQRFCMHDGPGVRTTVFFKGCPLRCKWCHNPETISTKTELMFYKNKCIGCGICASCGNKVHIFSDIHTVDRKLCETCGDCVKNCPTSALELSGRDMTVDEVFDEVIRDRAFYGSNGGITLSGGEPLMQADEAVQLLRGCREAGIGTAIETSGYFDPEVLRDVVPLCDLFLWDVKDTDAERHLKYTGKDNVRILENLHLADSLGAKTILRCILVSGVNTNAAHYDAIADLAHELLRCEGIEFLPYHSYGASKSGALGIDDNGHDEWIPSAGTVAEAKDYIKKRAVELF